MKLTPQRLGERSEEIACKALLEAGYKILERNYKTPRFEIDIIAREQGVLVFVEVRARRSSAWIHPMESIDHRKVRRLILGARYYVAQKRLDSGIRFDVVSITWHGHRYELEIIRDAFGW